MKARTYSLLVSGKCHDGAHHRDPSNKLPRSALSRFQSGHFVLTQFRLGPLSSVTPSVAHNALETRPVAVIEQQRAVREGLHLPHERYPRFVAQPTEIALAAILSRAWLNPSFIS